MWDPCLTLTPSSWHAARLVAAPVAATDVPSRAAQPSPARSSQKSEDGFLALAHSQPPSIPLSLAIPQRPSVSSITPTLSRLPPLLPDEFPFHRAARVNRLRVLRPLIPTCSPRRSGEARPSTTHPPPFLASAAFIWPPIHDRPTIRTPRHVGCYSSLRPRSRAHHRRYGACLAHQVPGAAPAQQPWRQPALHHLQLLRTLTPPSPSASR